MFEGFSFFPDLWRANALPERTFTNEAWRLPDSKLKENYRRCECKKNIFPEVKTEEASSVGASAQTWSLEESFPEDALVTAETQHRISLSIFCWCGTHQNQKALFRHVCVGALVHVCKLEMHPPDEERALWRQSSKTHLCLKRLFLKSTCRGEALLPPGVSACLQTDMFAFMLLMRSTFQYKYFHDDLFIVWISTCFFKWYKNKCLFVQTKGRSQVSIVFYNAS